MKSKVTTKPIVTTSFQTIREAVRSTGLSEYYLRKMYREGKLPHVMSGNRVLINVPMLIQKMNQMCMTENESNNNSEQ